MDIVGLKRQLLRASELNAKYDRRSRQSIFPITKSKVASTLPPNTAGCKTAREAITLAYMAREIF